MKGENYDEFVEKFKPKKTTDDCYTPENVYTAIAEWVAQKYQIDIKTFTRPFYPGGDYIKHDYSGKVVVDIIWSPELYKNNMVTHSFPCLLSSYLLRNVKIAQREL